MTNLTKKSNTLQEAVDSINRPFDLNRKMAARIKGKSINIHNKLAHLGGVKVIIQSLNEACLEFELKGSKDESELKALETIRQLRDLLIKDHYGLQVWNLMEPMLK